MSAFKDSLEQRSRIAAIVPAILFPILKFVVIPVALSRTSQ